MRNRHENMKTRRRIPLTASVAAALIAWTAVAAASPPARGPSLTLTYSPMALTSRRSVDALYARIVTAAKAVCPTYLRGLSFLHEQEEVRACREHAVLNAVHQIHDGQLAARLASIAARYRGQS